MFGDRNAEWRVSEVQSQRLDSLLRRDAAKSRKLEEMTAAVLCCTSSLQLPEIGDRFQKQETQSSLYSCSDTNTRLFSLWIFYEKGSSHLLTDSNAALQPKKAGTYEKSALTFLLFNKKKPMGWKHESHSAHARNPQKSRVPFGQSICRKSALTSGNTEGTSSAFIRRMFGLWALYWLLLAAMNKGDQWNICVVLDDRRWKP